MISKASYGEMIVLNERMIKTRDDFFAHIESLKDEQEIHIALNNHIRCMVYTMDAPSYEFESFQTIAQRIDYIKFSYERNDFWSGLDLIDNLKERLEFVMASEQLKFK